MMDALGEEEGAMALEGVSRFLVCGSICSIEN
jgi:hypothetical protein